MTREPGGIESEALQVEQVGGVVACIHREGEHEPGEDEAPGDERRREQCERGGSRDGVGAQAPLQLGARGHPDRERRLCSRRGGEPRLVRDRRSGDTGIGRSGERLSVGNDEIARERREAAGGFDDADPTAARPTRIGSTRADPAEAAMESDAITGIGTPSVGWRGLMRNVRSWVRK